MTDRSGPLGDPRVVLSGLLAVLIGAVVTLVSRTGDPATADTYLIAPQHAAVVLATGQTVVATDGMRVPNGAVVRTAPCTPGPCGGGRLSTAGRDVYLGAESAVKVTDGVHQDLQLGQVMVDGRHGPQLALGTRAGRVQVDDGALARVELGPVLRLAVFDGAASVTPQGRLTTTKVPALYQVLAPYVGLPGSPTALALLDDAWEQRLAGELVNADRDLNALEKGLDGPDGVTVLSAVSLRPVVPVPVARRGEEALSRALAQAADSGRSASDNFNTVQTARDQGGSWGVVAAIVRARVSAVSALLDSFLGGNAQGGPDIQALPTPALTDLFSPRPGRQPGSGRTPGPRPSPTPGSGNHSRSPAPSPSSVVNDVVSSVTTIVGSPAPSVSPSPLLPPLPLPTLAILPKLP